MSAGLGFDVESVSSQSVEEEEEDEALEMIKRASVRPSQLQASQVQASVAQFQQNQQRGSVSQVSNRSSFMGQALAVTESVRSNPTPRSGYTGLTAARGGRTSMFQGLGSIEEFDDDMFNEDDVEESEDDQLSVRSNEPAVSRDAQRQLRRQAEDGDTKIDRYIVLVQQGMNVVSEVKSALYDADDAEPDMGAAVLLDEVRDMMMNVVNTSLAEAETIRTPAETWVRTRRNLANRLKNNHSFLESSIQRRAEEARKSNAESRAECDRLWRTIQEMESEIESLPRSSMRGSPTDGDFAMSPCSDRSSVFSAPEQGQLSLEGAHSLLRSFNNVLRPFASEIIHSKPERRTSSEAIALEFLNACNESAKTAAETRKDCSKSPPPLEAPDKARCNSAPNVLHGIQVESLKPGGLLPLGTVKDPSTEGGRLLQEEQAHLLSKVGQSY